MKSTRIPGFTLVEVLIVVVILATLAAVIIPKVADSSGDAQAANAEHNLRQLRSQIELFTLQHHGTRPALNNIARQLTQKTDASGAVVADGAYGPYVQWIPENPFNNDSTIVSAGAVIPPVAPKPTGGWLYDEDSGQIWINDGNYLGSQLQQAPSGVAGPDFP
jgi:prepilin-type N-terminal cleavage/methylation domain-containing protein